MTKYFALFFILFFSHFSATAEEVVGGSGNNAPYNFANECVRTCMHYSKDKSSGAQQNYIKNCNSANNFANNVSQVGGATAFVGDSFNKLVFKCAPNSAVKAGQGIASFFSNLFTTDPKTKAEREQRMAAFAACEASKDCMRSSARQLQNLQKSSDKEVDEYLDGKNFKMVFIDVQNELSRLRPHCDTQYNFFTKSVMTSQPGELNYAKKREIFNRLAKDSPFCIGILQLAPPEMDPAVTALPKETKSSSALPTLEELSLWDKMQMSYGCHGDMFSEKFWDACAEGGSYLVPIPVGQAIKLVAKGYNAARFAKASAGIQKILDKLPAGHTPLSQIDGGVLTKFVAPDGKVTYQVFKPNGQVTHMRMDASGYAITGNNQSGREMINAELESGGKSAIFVDMNNLGQVNYFKDGAAAGDAYLKAVAKTLSEKVGANGTVYRYGGDEFVIVYNSTDKAAVTKITQEMSDAVFNNPEAKAIFRAEKTASAERYRQVMNTSSYEKLPESFKASLTPAEQNFAQKDFDHFKRIFNSVEIKRFADSAKLRASISVGSAVADGTNAQRAIGLANEGANVCKLGYKCAIGADTSKYTGRGDYLPQGYKDPSFYRRLNSKPVATPTY